MRIALSVHDRAFPTPEAFAQWVLSELENMVVVDRAELLRSPEIPLLYSSGVRYIPESRDHESFVDVYTVLQNKGGDCAHLCCWRVAELQNSGERATLAIKWNHPRFHIRVRRADSRLEDPSRVLGMGRKE